MRTVEMVGPLQPRRAGAGHSPHDRRLTRTPAAHGQRAATDGTVSYMVLQSGARAECCHECCTGVSMRSGLGRADPSSSATVLGLAVARAYGQRHATCRWSCRGGGRATPDQTPGTLHSL